MSPVFAQLPFLLTAFLVLFTADAGVSVVDDVGAALGLGHVLAAVRGPLASVTMLGCALLSVAFVLTPRVPWWPLLPLAFFPWALLVWGPIPMLVYAGVGVESAVPSLIQLLLTVLAWGAVRLRNGGWTVRPVEAPAFRFGHTALSTLVLGVGWPALLLWGLALEIEDASRGYVRITTRGVEVAEHLLYRDGRCARLIGMVHVGDDAYYTALLDELAASGVLVLSEGVSDPGHRLTVNSDGYAGVAAALGLVPQAAHAREAAALRSRNADVTTDAFSPPTLAVLSAALRLLGPNVDRAAALAEYRELATPEAMRAVVDDLLLARNDALVGHIERAAAEGESVAAPWGAVHLPGVEAALLERGWVRGGWRTRVVISWE